MKTQFIKKGIVILMAVVAMFAVLAVGVSAATESVSAEVESVEQEVQTETVPQEDVKTETAVAGFSVAELLQGIFNGTNLAILGAALAVALPCMGSARGVGIVGESAGGLLSEDPTLFGKALALQALPMTQGVYGLVAAFLIVNNIGLFSGLLDLSFKSGAFYLMASLPIALAGYYSAIRQGRVAASGINLLSKRPKELGKAVTSAALVETYAIFALLITLLLVFNGPKA